MTNEKYVVGVIGAGIVVALLLIPAFSSPWDNQIIDNTHTTIVSSGTNETTVCSNAGSGTILVKDSTDGNCTIRTIIGSGDISITNTSNTVIIDFNGTIASSESTTCYNVGTGYLLVKNSTSGNCYLKSLLAGTGITVSNGTNTITVTNAITNVENLLNTNINSPQNGQQLTYNSTSGKWENQEESEIDVGGGYSLFYTTIGNVLEFKTLLAGSGIGISAGATAVTISNTSPEATTCSNLGTGAGGYGIYKTGNCTFKSIKPSTGISMTNNTNDITITNSSPEATTCSSAGGTTIVKISGSSCTFYGLTASTGLSITQNANDNQYTNTGVITNSCSAPISCSGTNPSAISCATCSTNSAQETTVCNNVGTGTWIVRNSTSGNCNVKTLAVSTGISISNSTTLITFTNTGVTSNVAGTGISVSGATGAVTITNTGVISNSCTSPISCSGTNPSAISCSTCVTSVPVDDIDSACSGSYSSGTSQTCSISPTYNFYLISVSVKWAATGTDSSGLGMRFNADSGNNYAYRSSANGAADATSVSQAQFLIEPNCTGASLPCSYYCIVDNHASGTRKVAWCQDVQDLNTSAATAPARREFIGKWDNTAAQITSVTILNVGGTRAFASGTEVRVLGWN